MNVIKNSFSYVKAAVRRVWVKQWPMSFQFLSLMQMISILKRTNRKWGLAPASLTRTGRTTLDLFGDPITLPFYFSDFLGY